MMRNAFAILSAIVLTSACAIARADDAPLTPPVAAVRSCLDGVAKKKGASYRDCVGVTLDACGASGDKAVFDCQSEEAAAWDVLLNQRYHELERALPRETFEKLRDVERAWVKLRDGKCGLFQELARVGETARDKLEQGCRLEETARRADELAQLQRLAK